MMVQGFGTTSGSRSHAGSDRVIKRGKGKRFCQRFSKDNSGS